MVLIGLKMILIAFKVIHKKQKKSLIAHIIIL